jgi:hypothetical protein
MNTSAKKMPSGVKATVMPSGASHAGDSGGQRERHVDDGVEQPAAGKSVADDRPDHKRAEEQIRRCRSQSKPERQLEGVKHAMACDHGDKFAKRQLSRS